MRLKAANVCIYCGAPPDGSDEHIVPESLNGRLILPNATCKTCKDTINHEIETPLAAKHYKTLRTLLRYKSKSRGKKKAYSLPIQYRWHFVILRRTPPFQTLRPIYQDNEEYPEIQFKYAAPKFLRESIPELATANTPSIAIGNNDRSVSNKLHNDRISALHSSDPDIVSVSISTPSFRNDLIPRALMKIARGILFGLYGDPGFPDMKNAILFGMDKYAVAKFIRSVHRRHFDIDDGYIKMKTVGEGHENILYISLILFPEYFSEVYFVRVRISDGIVIDESIRFG